MANSSRSTSEAEYYDVETEPFESEAEYELELTWAAMEKLPSVKRTNVAMVRRTASEVSRGGGKRMETIDVRKLDRKKREIVVQKALDTCEQDNLKLLIGIKERLNRVGLELPKVEVRFENLKAVAKVQTGKRALPTLFNYARDIIEDILTGLKMFRPRRHSLTILNNITGYLRPQRYRELEIYDKRIYI
ncbi:hypothetical protein Dimus_009231 [Dionaea muscipula]